MAEIAAGRREGAAAILVAAGRGLRLGGPVPKQYRTLGGVAVLAHAVRAFASHPRIATVRVVIAASDRALYDAAMAGLGLPPPVIGGDTRQRSVLNGLESLASGGGAPDRVLIHDGVRPFVEAAVIDRVLDALDTEGAALACVAVSDTLKRGEGGFVSGTVDRAGMWRAQTPQGFRFETILAAHREAAADPALADLTDDTQLVEARGVRVAIVEGAEDNFKITTEPDLARGERLLAIRAAAAAA